MVGVAAEISGSLLYDGQPVSTIFPDITTVVATANPWEPGDQVEGTVDLASSTYSFAGLETGLYGVSIYLDRVPPASNVGQEGDLRAYQNIDVTDPQEALDVDFDILYNYWVVSPINSKTALDGSGQDCTTHPAVTYPISFAIELVPRAVNYVFNAGLQECPGFNLGWIVIESTQPSMEIVWGTADEDHQTLYVSCTGASGRPLCSGPTFEYNDSHVWALLLRNREGTGRGIHRTDTYVVPGVAKVQGANGVYWYTVITAVSQEMDDALVDIIFTPRGVDGSETFYEVTEMFPARERIEIWDPVDWTTGSTGTGTIEFRGAELVISSRTSTASAQGGSYGQGIPPIQPEQVLSLGGTAHAEMGGVEENADFRTNLGLSEIWGEPATVRVSIRSGEGGPPSSADYQLRPYENIQINRVADVIAGATDFEAGVITVSITEGNGRIGAYLSVVDNATGDPTFIAIAPQAPAGG